MLVPSIFENNSITNLFDDVFRAAGFGRDLNSHFSSMNMDVKELDDSYQLEVELPGVKKEDIRAEIKDGYLTIKASNNHEDSTKDEDGKYIRRERYYGNYQRSMYVGENVRPEEIQANFEDGILKVTVPKKMQELPKEEHNYIPIA